VILLVSGASADLADRFLPGVADFWLTRLVLNMLAYGTILVPGYLLIQYFRKNRYNDQKRGERQGFPGSTGVKRQLSGHQSRLSLITFDLTPYPSPAFGLDIHDNSVYPVI